MRYRYAAASLAVLMIGLSDASAQGRRGWQPPAAECCPPVVPFLPPPRLGQTSPTPPSTDRPGEDRPTRPGEETSRPDSPAAQQPSSNAFNEALASAGEGGTQPGASYQPGFFGDLLGSCTITVAEFWVPYDFETESEGSNILVERQICVPDIAQASGMKIAESDSPRPLDRVYYLYNFYGNIRTSPDPTLPSLHLHRHILGFEKTFLGGDASIGLRAPFFRLTGSQTYDTALPGDISVITKFALFNNPTTGNVLSGGLVVTAPTGGETAFLGIDGDRFTDVPRVRGVYLQPYAGYIYNTRSRFYFHGFHSIAIPTEGAFPTFMANDIGMGVWAYRNPNDGIIRGILPTAELHINTPFTRREPAVNPGQYQMLDSVNLTSGLYILFPRSILGAAAGVPLRHGPHTIEALVSYTLRF